MSVEYRFCLVIENFWKALSTFAKALKDPTEKSIELIQLKGKRTNRFDEYVEAMSEFNILMDKVSRLIKNILVWLVKVFLDKDQESLIKFFDSLNLFLNFLSTDEAFPKLNEIKHILQKNYRNDTAMLDKIDTIHSIIFKICNITITITSLFIPQVAVIHPIIQDVESLISKKIHNERGKIADSQIDIDALTHKLTNIQIKADILTYLDTNNIFKCLNDKNSQELIRKIDLLQEEYCDIIVMLNTLGSEIKEYKKRNPSVFANILHHFCG